MRAARYCYAVVWCVVVGDSVRPGRGDGMEQVIYASSGHGRPMFFVVKKETAKRVVLKQIGQRFVSGDWMNGYVVAAPEKDVPYWSDLDEVQMMKRDGYLWNAKERLYASVWNGGKEHVYCD